MNDLAINNWWEEMTSSIHNCLVKSRMVIKLKTETYLATRIPPIYQEISTLTKDARMEKRYDLISLEFSTPTPMVVAK